MTIANYLSFVIIDGQPLPIDEAQVGLTSRLTMYGEGFFDTLRAWNGGFLKPGEHLKRLHTGMNYLGLAIPAALKNEKKFLEELARFLETNGAMDRQVRIRVQIWAGDHTAGYLPGHHASARPVCYMITGSLYESESTGISGRATAAYTPGHAAEAAKYDRTTSTRISGEREVPVREESDRSIKAVRLITSRYHRIPSGALPSGVKWSNGINYILAAREADDNKADDALMLTRDGYVSETTIANIFWKKENSVLTPSVECDLLPGITRKLLIDWMQELNINVQTGQFLPAELEAAEMVWACNAVREWYPVYMIDQYEYPIDGDFWKSLSRHFQKRKQEELIYVR